MSALIRHELRREEAFGPGTGTDDAAQSYGIGRSYG